MRQAPERSVYGYTWYLDAVTSAPGWRWLGLVLPAGAGAYRAVLPVPLRRKWGRWVVHQPLFCQFLAIYAPQPVEPAPFLTQLTTRFRYGSALHLRSNVVSLGTPDRNVVAELRGPLWMQRPLATHVVDLSADYAQLYANYTNDRRLNLRRAQAAGWHVVDSADPEPLIRLFRDHHAAGIPGGVAEGAYDTFRRLIAELHRRGLAQLRYAIQGEERSGTAPARATTFGQRSEPPADTDWTTERSGVDPEKATTLAGRIHAGALFMREGNRITYLFNAADGVGRRGNARTLLIDQVLRENAGRAAGRAPAGNVVTAHGPERSGDHRAGGPGVAPLLFDFESPEKPSIVQFYRSFGAVEEPFWDLRWNRLSPPENLIRAVLRTLIR